MQLFKLLGLFFVANARMGSHFRALMAETANNLDAIADILGLQLVDNQIAVAKALPAFGKTRTVYRGQANIASIFAENRSNRERRDFLTQLKRYD